MAEQEHPVGTRVKPRYDKTSAMRGTVVGHREGFWVRVQWDGRSSPDERVPGEIKRAE